jgi:hypothetical protein
MNADIRREVRDKLSVWALTTNPIVKQQCEDFLVELCAPTVGGQGDEDIRVRIAEFMTRRCSNCYCQLPGYNVKGDGWHWLTENIGPFCDDCWSEIPPAR